MLLRFQGFVPNEGTPSKLGIFQLASAVRDHHETPDYAVRELRTHLQWLNDNLDAPSVLREHGNHRAICWFKSAARKPLSHIWPIKAVLVEFGYHIELIKIASPGNVIYEDGWQVVAKPWRNTRRF